MKLIPAKGVNIRDAGLPPNKRWLVTQKVDGVRRLFLKEGGKVTAFSSTGIPDPWLAHITDYLERPTFPDMVYDCELVDRELYWACAESFLLRTASVGKAAQQYSDNKKDLIAVCFEVFTPGSMMLGDARDRKLRSIFGYSSLNAPVIMVPHYGMIGSEDVDMLTNLMNIVRKLGGEGLMLMDLDSIHIPGRSKTRIKVKRFEEFIGTIIDYEEARVDTKIEGGIAAFICKVDGCNVPVRVGSGLTNSERIEYKELGLLLLGRKIEIEAFGKSRDHAGNISLSTPIFKLLI